MDSESFFRTRNICLAKTESDGTAIKVCAILQGIKGVSHASPINKHRIKLCYSLEFLSFELIEELLKELGYGLDYSLPAYLRRYYYQYTEDNVRESLKINDEKQELSCRLDPLDADNPDQYWDEYR